MEEGTPRRRTPRRDNAEEDVQQQKGDRYIWGIYLFILVVSVVELYSASSIEVKADSIYGPLFNHLKFLVLGFLLILGCQRLHYKYYLKFAWPIALICLGLVVLTYMFGVTINGAQRALRFCGFTIQPSEMLKLGIVVLLARIMAKNQVSGGVSMKGILLCFVVVLIAGGAVYKNGLTNMILVMGVSICMLWIAGTAAKRFWIVVAVYAAIGYVSYNLVYSDHHGDDALSGERVEMVSDPTNTDRSGTRMKRIERFIRGVHPNDTITDENYQVMHANFAMAHGGLRGNGPGNSRESARLPLAFSDYIYSIVVEDCGLVGGILLLLAYLALVARAGSVAASCSRAFPALLIMGCAVMIVLQAFVHMAIVTGLFPVSGQPLPFISKGGTSILVMSVALGMMLSVSKHAVRSNNTKKEINREIRELPDGINSVNPMQLKK